MRIRRPSPPVMIILFVLTAIGISSSCNCLTGDAGLKYEFVRDDAAYLFPVAFDLEEVPGRLDASGHYHTGYVPNESAANVYDIYLDNRCGMARVQFDSGVFTTMRVLGVDPRGNCPKDTTAEALVDAVSKQLIPRLDGTAPPRAPTEPTTGDRYTYPSAAAPTLEVESSMVQFVRNLDYAFLGHEFHDGVYELGEFACYARLRLVESPSTNHVTVVGEGYVQPCSIGKTEDRCLDYWFRLFLRTTGLELVATPTTPVEVALPTRGPDTCQLD